MMEIVSCDALSPDSVVWVRPIGIERIWWRGVAHIGPLVAAYNAAVQHGA